MISDSNFKDVVTQVLAANDIVDILGGYLELKPSGGMRFKALCPFHNEKTPSFVVNRDRQTYYCFGCEKNGDAISFIQDHDGLTFRETLQKLADRAGIRLPEFSSRGGSDDGQRGKLLELAKYADKLFRTNLHHESLGQKGRAYLDTRGLKDETIKTYGLGYTPDEWSILTDAARKDGFSEKELEDCGLAKRGQKGGLYDHFRNRLIIPIRDVAGNVVAFGGRDLGDSPAKYINSPESGIYKKARVLYGLHEARDAMRKEKEAILVEGYFDALRCYDAGIENVVATCGTALTPEQATLIRRYVPSVLVVFDGDTAGIRAALRSVSILTAAGLSVRPMLLPDAQDPDDFIKASGADAFRDLARKADDFVTFYVNANAERIASIEGRTEVAKELFGILRDIEDGIRRDEYLKTVAHNLGLNADRCREEFSRFLVEQNRRPAPVHEEHPQPTFKISYEDRVFLSTLLANQSLVEEFRNALAQDDLPESPLRQVLMALMHSDSVDIMQRLESDQARQLYAAAANADDDTQGERGEVLVKARIISFKKASLERTRRGLQEEIEQAQRQNDASRLDELILRKITIDREIENAGAA